MTRWREIEIKVWLTALSGGDSHSSRQSGAERAKKASDAARAALAARATRADSGVAKTSDQS